MKEPICATAQPGTIGFDANCPILPSTARAFYDHGYRFAVRYIPRLVARDSDISADQVEVLLAAGLGVMPVQHVESEESWIPSADKGRMYGVVAARECVRVGFVPGCTVWLDLEGVARDVRAEAVAAYCNNWHAAIADAGFLPGLYVGWHCGLSATQLYRELRFTRYWSAYNLNANEYPAVRGVCMQQHTRNASDIPFGVKIEFDVNSVRLDGRGDLPTFLSHV